MSNLNLNRIPRCILAQFRHTSDPVIELKDGEVIRLASVKTRQLDDEYVAYRDYIPGRDV